MYNGIGNMMRSGYCSSCGSVLLIPLGAQLIRCAICQAITGIFDPPEAPPASQQPSSSSSSPSPYNHAPPGPPPSPHGPKRAVICGIVYRNSLRPLEGCINDAKLMHKLCIEKFNFPKSSIIMLTEEETEPSRLPTKKNMRMALYWLVQGCQPGDSLLFHYSGHGSQIKNNNGDEVDGKDEALCPLDFETQGNIVDDEINHTIVNPLPPGAKLHAIIDACHSGTALDLPFLCRMNNDTGTHNWDDHRPRSGVWKGTNGGNAILFSGCDDHQSSRELPKNTSAALLDRTITGVMTVSFIRAIEELGVGATYGSILTSTRNTIPLTNADAVKSFLEASSLGDRVYNKLMTERSSLGDAIKSVVSMLQEYESSAGSRSVGRRDRNQSRQDEIYIQEPQLTSDHQFDIHAKRFFP